MKSPSLSLLWQSMQVDPTKALGSGVQQMNASAQSVNTSVGGLKKLWLMVSPVLPWLLLAVAVVALGYGAWKLWGWWRKRRAPAQVSSGPAPMGSGRLLQVRRGFLNGLPLANRAAVVDLPNVVVLGPAGSGKTQLIGLDVDWQRQARQFLPSYTSDALLQFYLGPDCVVQEVSAPLLEG